MPKTNKPTTHKLEDTDISLLRYTQRHQQAIFSGLLSNIAMRLGYEVTENTQFQLSAGLDEITITELKEQDLGTGAVKQA